MKLPDDIGGFRTETREIEIHTGYEIKDERERRGNNGR